MGLYQHIKNWFSMPLSPNTDVVSLTIYVGIIFLIVWLWNSVILTVGRIGKAVTA